jgi:hypothetical protein
MVSGSVRGLLRLEALAVMVAAGLLYSRSGAGWGQFVALFLVPDVSFAGYLFGPRIGAASYNTMHSYLGPVLLGVLTGLGLLPAAIGPVAMIWAAHVGFDRSLGYGLKYATAFGDTHLGQLKAPGARVAAPAR